MTVCGNSLNGVCGSCEHLQACRNSELDKVPITNEEWIHTLNTEQLAEWLFEHADCKGCECNKDLCYQGYDCCKLVFVEWLKEVHK